MNIYYKIRGILARLKWRTETVVMLAAARFLVKFVPFRRWRSSLGPIENSALEMDTNGLNDMSTAQAKRVGRWVRDTAGKVPFEAVCLPQAMAARWMLLRRNIPTQLYIGTNRDQETSAAKFHAWLMHGEICLTGHHEREEFQAFGKSGKLREAL